MFRPDYTTLKKETPFSWNVSATYLALLEATGIPVKEMFLSFRDMEYFKLKIFQLPEISCVKDL